MGNSRRVGALDGVRGLAILAVFASHTGFPLTGGGWIGVEVFFFLSGYLITTLLLAERDATGTSRLGRFYARRALRLVPALVGVLLVVLLARGLLDLSLDEYLWRATVAVLYVQDFASGLFDAHGPFGHTWSLAVEEQFYLVWPLVLALVVTRVRRAGWVVGAAAAAGLVAVAAWPGGSDLWYYLPWVQAPVLLGGAALAFALRGRPGPGTTLDTAVSWAGLLGLGVVTVVASQVSRADVLGLLLVGATACTAAVISGVVRCPGSGIDRLLAWRPLAGLGLVSYGFYLYYLPVITVLGDSDLRRAVAMPIAFAVTLTLALLSYRVVERPFLRLKKRYGAPGSARPLDDLSRSRTAPAPTSGR